MTDSALTVLFTQRVGAFDRIVSLLRRRGFPVAGMTLERTHQPDIGRMTVVVERPEAVAQVRRHLSRLPDVVEVDDGCEGAVRREFALIRIRCSEEDRPELLSVLRPYDARLLSATAEQVVVEAAGESAELDELLVQLALYGIEDCARTNPIVMRASC